jgi:fluoroquinolone transport system permease protein
VSRLLSTLALDARIQLRSGLYVASAFVAVCSALFLSWLGPRNAEALLPPFLLEAVLINTFYFMAGLLLLERTEGTLVAQRTTPLRDGEYLVSKIMTLSALSLVECLSISTVVAGFGPHLLEQSLGIVLASAFLGLSGVAVAARYDSINRFLLPSALYTFVLSLPILGYFGVGDWAWYLPHPLRGPMDLLQAQTRHTPSVLIYATFYPLLWMIPLYRWSRRELRRAYLA